VRLDREIQNAISYFHTSQSHLIIHHQNVDPSSRVFQDREDIPSSPPNANPRLPLSPQILLRVRARLLLLLLLAVLLRRHDFFLVLLLRREGLSRASVFVRRDVLGRYLEGRRRASEHPCYLRVGCRR
jgi:hypothetical protein